LSWLLLLLLLWVTQILGKMGMECGVGLEVGVNGNNFTEMGGKESNESFLHTSNAKLMA